MRKLRVIYNYALLNLTADNDTVTAGEERNTRAIHVVNRGAD